jgi:hypothetical protein
MRSPLSVRRTAIVVAALSVAACDVVDFANNPMPQFLQTWNIPAAGTSVSVGSLLPSGVSIYSTPSSTPPDSSAFDVDIDTMDFSRRLGLDCASCQALNGTTAIKDSFNLVSSSSEPLPADMVSGAVIGGAVRVSVRNTLSFDPIRVRSTGTQGFLLIVVRSGSLVLGRDSTNGATTAFVPGDSIVRTINLSTGTVVGSITVDITIMSPRGDAPVQINANGTIRTIAITESLLTASIRMNVVNKALSSADADSLALDGLEPGVTRRIIGGGLDMAVTNPFAVAGDMQIIFGYRPGQNVVKTVPLPTGVDQPAVAALDSADIQNIVGRKVQLSIGGTVNSASPINVTPRQSMQFSNRMMLRIRVGGGN